MMKPSALATKRGHLPQRRWPRMRLASVALIATAVWLSSAVGVLAVGASWKLGPTVSIARSALGVASGPKGVIYAFGGYNGTFLSTAEAYSPVTKIWRLIAPMPSGQAELGGAYGSDGRIYAVGGDLTPTALFAYSPASNAWTTLAPIPHPHTELAAVADRHGHVYALGGTTGAGGLSSIEARVDIYNVETNRWSPDPRCPLQARDLQRLWAKTDAFMS